MPRYFVHSIDASRSVFDDIGRELNDVEAARQHAMWCARDILAHSLLLGHEVDSGAYLTVQDVEGHEYCRVPFREFSEQLGLSLMKETDLDGWAGPDGQAHAADRTAEPARVLSPMVKLAIMLGAAIALWVAIIVVIVWMN